MRVTMKKIMALVCILVTVMSVNVSASSADEPVEIVVETVTLSSDNPGITAVEDAVNEITIPAIGVKVKLKNMSISQHERTIGQLIDNNEKLDLIMVGMTNPITDMAAEGLLMPIDDLVEQYGPVFEELFGEMMKAGKVGDTLYAIPARTNNAMSSGILYNTEMAFQAGIDIPEKLTRDDLDEIFAAVKKNVPDVYMTSFISGVSMMGFFYNIETYGSDSNTFGVTFDPWNGTEIVNLYKSQEYLDYCKKMREWNELGYFPPNIMTSSVVPSERLADEQIFCLFTGYSPMSKTGELKGEYTDLSQMTEAVIKTESFQERMWGISAKSRNPEKAMELLNLMYSNDELANILMNGIEGVHYTKISDNIITHTENQDYYRVFSFFGDQHKVLQWFPSEEDVFEKQQEFEQNSKVSLTLGYIFDNTEVQRETEVVNKVISMYAPALEFGMVEDIEGALETFNNELDKAGIEIIIEENRRQLKEWLSEQN